ncbi:MAG: solute carrier family 23 protein [Pseudomonadota bacterium]
MPENTPTSPAPPDDLLYGLNDRPPLFRTILYGLQWLLIFLPIAGVVSMVGAEVLGLSTALREAFFQRLLLITGLTMIVQTLWGHKMPILDGPSTALVVTTAALAFSGQAVVNGGMIMGGTLVLLCGLLKTMRHLTRLFTRRVVGVILLLIGVTVMPYLLPMLLGADAAHPHGRPGILLLSFFLVLVQAFMFKIFKGLWQSLSLFLGVLLGAAVFGIMGLLDFSRVAQAGWLTRPNPFWSDLPQFDLGASISFVLAYLAVIVNHAGSLFSTESLVQADDIEGRLNRGLVVTGLSGIAAGLTGVIGTVAYSSSPGVILITRVGSRFAMTACGVILVSLAFFGKFSAALSSIPDPVVGAAMLASLAAGTGVAVDIAHQAGSKMSMRDYMVIGLPVLMGLAVSLLPKEFIQELPSALRPVIGNGLIVGVVLVVFLENVLLRDSA